MFAAGIFSALELIAEMALLQRAFSEINHCWPKATHDIFCSYALASARKYKYVINYSKHSSSL